ncbi:hypothetical protein ACFYYS_00190 [Streptomyces sp. NPDC002120]|uniref:hypothetical protein n=1 Tax=Streptomyces sp. NPDC002120 TaxID=3364631 RepID=UPI0036A5023F
MEEIRNNPAKYLGIIGALLALAATYVPGLPTEAILAVVAALIGGGVAAQKVEDSKTEEALMEATPDEMAMERQMNLLASENAMLQEQQNERPAECPCQSSEPSGEEHTAELDPVRDDPLRKPNVAEFSLDDGRALFRL